MNDLPEHWQTLRNSVHPDAAVCEIRLKQIPDLAREHCFLSEKQLKAVASYAAEIRKDDELFQRWSMAREIVLRTKWDDTLEAPFPAWFRKNIPEEAFLLTLAVSGIPDAEENFRRKHLPLEKLYESFDEFHSWTDNCERNYGLTGLEFDNGFAWIMLRLFTGDVLRFGRLEYNRCRSFCDVLAFRHKRSGELRVLLNGSYAVNEDGRVAAPGENIAFRTDHPFGIFGPYYGYPVSEDGRIHRELAVADPAEWECVLRPWDPVLYMHIPELGPLTPEQVRKSYADVRKFYSRADSDYHPKAIICGSWLFDPVLQELLPDDSNLCRFQKSGFILPSHGKKSDAVRRVFGVQAAKNGISSVEWKTGLQKALGKYIMDGGFCRGGRFLLLF